jgi:acetylglutamate kinase
VRLVIKLGGALLDKPDTVHMIAQQVSELKQKGHELLVVHGGGKIFTSVLERMGMANHFVDGLRVTNDETRDVAVMVLGGLLNKRIVTEMSQAGQPAVGLAGSDARCFLAEPLSHNGKTGSLYFVGYLTAVNVEFLELLWRTGIVPVASCLGMGADGETYNINADHMAAACADYCRAQGLIYLTDVPGVLDGEAVLPSISPTEMEKLIRQQKIRGGMLLKLEACTRALHHGVSLVHIIGGTLPKSLLTSLNGTGLGTRVLLAPCVAAEVNL